MTSTNVIRRTSIIGVRALVAILAVGTVSMAAAQNNNGGNPFDAVWAAIEDLRGQDDAQQTQIDELTDRIDFLESRLTGDCNASPAPGVDLHNCKLAGVDLSDTDLRRADLRRANLTGADLTNANLFEANLASANLTDAALDCINHTICN